ncbi:MAG: YhbY family RNA-binding protein [Clostridia bacterium]|nr:YhbY family RNA-binding protein [Clostridia bacterium]
MTSKQRAYLRGLASKEDTILHIGKNGLGHNLVKELDDALEARELVKGKTLETSPLTPREAAEELASQVGGEVVTVIGTKFVIYRRSKKPKIELPR